MSLYCEGPIFLELGVEVLEKSLPPHQSIVKGFKPYTIITDIIPPSQQTFLFWHPTNQQPPCFVISIRFESSTTMSFFAKFYKTGTTAIAQQDIKVKTVKVPNTATAPHTLPMVGHQRPAPSRSPSSTNLTQNTTTSTTASTSISTIKAKSTKSKRTNLVSPPLPGCERSRDSKNAQGRSAERGDISSVKRKGSSSSFTRLDNRTSSLRSVSSSTELATSHSKKRCLTPSAPHHRTSPIQEKLVSSDEESDSPSDYDARAGSTEERLLKLQKAQELGLTTRVYLNPKSFRPDRMSFVHADQIANMDKEGYRRGISWFFLASYVVIFAEAHGALYIHQSWRTIYLFSLGTS